MTLGEALVTVGNQLPKHYWMKLSPGKRGIVVSNHDHTCGFGISSLEIEDNLLPDIAEHVKDMEAYEQSRGMSTEA